MTVAVLSVLALILFSFLFEKIHLVIFAPWAMSLDGSPTLTGTWVGRLHSKWGSDYQLVLDLQWKPPSALRSRDASDYSRADLVGNARICNRAGKVFRMAVSGDANRDASDVRVWVEARESQYQESMPLNGSWHGDTLRLTAFTTPFGPEGELRGARSTVSRSTTDAAGRFIELYPNDLTSDQVPADSFPDVTLQKGGESEFQSGCDALRG